MSEELKPEKMRVDSDWLKSKIENSPDSEAIEAGYFIDAGLTLPAENEVHGWNNPIIEGLGGLIRKHETHTTYCDECFDSRYEAAIKDLTNLINKHKEG